MRRRGLRGMYISRKALRSHFDPRVYPRETYLLCELQWEGSRWSWIHWMRNNADRHAEEYFLEEVFEPRSYGFCNITLYLSWSPCCSCCSKILDFLKRHPNVKIDIRVARLIYLDHAENRSSLRELNGSQRVSIRVMEDADYSYCWETFIQGCVCYDFFPMNFESAIRRYRSILKNILTDYHV